MIALHEKTLLRSVQALAQDAFLAYELVQLSSAQVDDCVAFDCFLEFGLYIFDGKSWLAYRGTLCQARCRAQRTVLEHSHCIWMRPAALSICTI